MKVSTQVLSFIDAVFWRRQRQKIVPVIAQAISGTTK
jgi:hypothetical protein